MLYLVEQSVFNTVTPSFPMELEINEKWMHLYPKKHYYEIIMNTIA